MSGVALELYHPRIAARDCGHCQKFHYDEETGEPVRDERATGALGEGGMWYRRSPAPCRLERGCPKGTPEDPLSLSQKNRRAYEHYQECKATGNFPEDAIVARNAGIIRRIEDSKAQADVESTRKMLETFARAMLR